MRFWETFERVFKHVEIPAEHLPIVRGEQITAFKKALPFGVGATLVNAIIVITCAAFTEATINLWIWSAIMLITTGVGVPAAYQAHKSKKTVYPRPARDMRKPLQSAAAIGLSWSLGLILLMPGAPATQQMLMTTVCAGMMCGGAYIFSTVPRAAVTFVATIALGFVIAVTLSGLSGGAIALIALLVCYSLVMFHASYWNYTNYARAWLQQIELNSQKIELGNQNEVINLLLKDFEETASDCLWETDGDQNLMHLSEELAARLNIDAAHPMPHKIADLLIQGGADEHDIIRLINEAAEESFFKDYMLRLKTASGDRWLSFSGKRKESGGYRGVVADVTDAQEAEAKIRHLAHFDGLTGLANREQLKLELAAAFETERNTGEAFAMLCLDLDRFKIINDAHGHMVGDAVLTVSADRMQACLGKGDVAARVGGDEFTVLKRANNSLEDVISFAENIIKVLEEPIKIDDLVVQVSASVGISLCPEHGKSANDLLKNADLALYRAKQNGRAQVCVFEQDMDDEASQRRALESDLREAIREGQFRLFFQPLVDSITRKAVGFEALLRWEHPERGLVRPEEFIGVAEKTGMISNIGEWVIREALNEAACWTDEQSVSVNLSPLQVKSPTLMPCVINALASSGVAPNRLEFEITESVLLDDSDNSLKTLHELHEMGIRISLDDFGTGYSSLSYLSSFPFDKIKIDKSFVQSIGDSTECRAIVRAVTGLAGSLGMRSTAEGLETQEQIDGVMAEGCSELQGFYFSKPQSAETLEKAGLLRRKTAPARSRNSVDQLSPSPSKDGDTVSENGETNPSAKPDRTGS